MPESNEAIIQTFFDLCDKLTAFAKSSFTLRNCRFYIKINRETSSQFFLPIADVLNYKRNPYIQQSSVTTAIEDFMAGTYSLIHVRNIDEDLDADEESNNADREIEMTQEDIDGLIGVCSSLFHTVSFYVTTKVIMYNININRLNKSNVNLIVDDIDFNACNICKSDNINSISSFVTPIRTFLNCTFDKGWSVGYTYCHVNLIYDDDTNGSVNFSALAELDPIRYSIMFCGKPSGPVLWSSLPKNTRDEISIYFKGADNSFAGMINELSRAIVNNNLCVGINLSEPIEGQLNLLSLLMSKTPLTITKNSGTSQLQTALNIFYKYFVSTDVTNATENVLDCQEDLIEMGLSKYARI